MPDFGEWPGGAVADEDDVPGDALCRGSGGDGERVGAGAAGRAGDAGRSRRDGGRGHRVGDGDFLRRQFGAVHLDLVQVARVVVVALDVDEVGGDVGGGADGGEVGALLPFVTDRRAAQDAVDVDALHAGVLVARADHVVPGAVADGLRADGRVAVARAHAGAGAGVDVAPEDVVARAGLLGAGHARRLPGVAVADLGRAA